MEPFFSHTGKIAVLNQADVDTDQIIPARFLSMVTRTGYGEELFRDLRSPKFPLDDVKANGATILVTAENFGCGSSREHAVWAIQQAGFVAVISKYTDRAAGFSDIFRQNSSNNGLLLIELDEATHALLTSAESGACVTINLSDQYIELNSRRIEFQINPTTKDAIMNGRDLIGTTLVHETQITKYEAEHGPWVPPSAH